MFRVLYYLSKVNHHRWFSLSINYNYPNVQPSLWPGSGGVQSPVSPGAGPTGAQVSPAVCCLQGHMPSFVQVKRESVEVDNTVRYLDLLQVDIRCCQWSSMGAKTEWINMILKRNVKCIDWIYSRLWSPDITGCVTNTALRVTTRGRTWLTRLASGPRHWCIRSSPWRPWLSEMASSFSMQIVGLIFGSSIT